MIPFHEEHKTVCNPAEWGPTLNSIRQTDVDTLMIRTQSRVRVTVWVRVRDWAKSYERPFCFFRAEKHNEHAWTFVPRSPGRVWIGGGISNILFPKNKMFPLITWKEQVICLQKLQAVVITLSLLNFLEEYLIVKRTLNTLISLRCTRKVHG